MQALRLESVTVDKIDLPLLKEKNVELSVLRLDKIHRVISGNKWFKLHYYLKNASAEGKTHLATFGGAYSNHIIATAAAGKLFDFKTTGIIRGERPRILSPTLLQAIDFGMELFFVNREDYRNKILPKEILRERDTIYIIDEGGYGKEGAKGASEILNYCNKELYSYIACAVGTTTMMAGLVKASLPMQKVIGFSVLKNDIALEKDLCNLLSTDEQKKTFQIIHDYHFGGYAKHTRELISSMNELYATSSIPTDFVYTAKLFYGIFDLIKNDSFPDGSKILAVHSGGLQGNLSLPHERLFF